MLKQLKSRLMLLFLAFNIATTTYAKDSQQINSSKVIEDSLTTNDEKYTAKINDFKNFFKNFKINCNNPCWPADNYIVSDLIDGQIINMPTNLRESLFIKEVTKQQSKNKYFISEEDYNRQIQNKITKISENHKHCDFEWDNDIAKLKQKIKDNTNEYFNNELNCEYFNFFDPNTYDSIEQYNYYQDIFSEVIDDYFKTATNDITEDVHQMQSLVIMIGDISFHGQYDPLENIIYIDNTLIDFLLKPVLSHEFNHLRQTMCPCRTQISNNGNFGMQYSRPVGMLIETSAESYLYRYLDLPETSAYHETRDKENLLFLLAITNNSSLKQYYDAMFDSDIASLLKFFNITNVTEIQEFYKILYVLSIYQRLYLTYNNHWEFLEKYDSFINLTLFKLCMMQLIDYTENNPDFNLTDNLAIFTFIKTLITMDSYEYDENGSRQYDSQFVSNMPQLVKKYNEYLCFKYNVSMEEIDLKKDNINEILEKLEIYSQNPELNMDPAYDEIKILVQKFPLLEEIIATYKGYGFSNYNYDVFLADNNLLAESLSKKK